MLPRPQPDEMQHAVSPRTVIQSSTEKDDCPRYGSVPIKKYTQQLLTYSYPTPGLLQHHTVEKVLPYSANKTGPLQPNQLVLPSPSGPHPHPQQELNLEPTISTPTQQQPYQHQGQWTKPALPTPSGPQCYTHQDQETEIPLLTPCGPV